MVEEDFDAFPRGQFAAFVLRFDSLFTAAKFGTGAPFVEGLKNVFHKVPAQKCRAAITAPRLSEAF